MLGYPTRGVAVWLLFEGLRTNELKDEIVNRKEISKILRKQKDKAREGDNQTIYESRQIADWQWADEQVWHIYLQGKIQRLV